MLAEREKGVSSYKHRKENIVRIATLHLVVPRPARGADLFGLNRLDADLDRNGTGFLVGLGSQ